jgi:hypothetical protein
MARARAQIRKLPTNAVNWKGFFSPALPSGDWLGGISDLRFVIMSFQSQALFLVTMAVADDILIKNRFLRRSPASGGCQEAEDAALVRPPGVGARTRSGRRRTSRASMPPHEIRQAEDTSSRTRCPGTSWRRQTSHGAYRASPAGGVAGSFTRSPSRRRQPRRELQRLDGRARGRRTGRSRAARTQRQGIG